MAEHTPLQSPLLNDGQKRCAQCSGVFTPKQDNQLTCGAACSLARERDRARAKRRVQPEPAETKAVETAAEDLDEEPFSPAKLRRTRALRDLPEVRDAVFNGERQIFNPVLGTRSEIGTRPLKAGQALYVRTGADNQRRVEETHDETN